ncbi:MAG: hypothetical protein DMG58_34025, partial [Acidobacteria bacterium]
SVFRADPVCGAATDLANGTAVSVLAEFVTGIVPYENFIASHSIAPLLQLGHQAVQDLDFEAVEMAARRQAQTS